MKLTELLLVLSLIFTFSYQNVHTSATNHFLELQKVIQPSLAFPKCSSKNIYGNRFEKSIVSDPVKKFQVLHVFDNGNGPGSFETFTENANLARRFLIEMHRKLPDDNLLPTIRNFDFWLQNKFYRKNMFLIDTNISQINSDIRPQFERWKTSQQEKGYNRTNWSTSLTTNSVYHCTNVSFVVVKNNDKVVEVEVWANKLETPLRLWTDGEGNVIYSRYCSYAITRPENPERKKVTTFTTEELNQNAKIIGTFWRELGVTGKPIEYYGVLNEQGALFLGLKEANNEELNRNVIEPTRKSSKGNVCYLFEGWNAEKIDPAKFIEEYKNANKTGQHQLANLVKENKQKISRSDRHSENRQQMEKLIQLEDVKSHATSVNAVTDALTKKPVSNLLDYADLIKAIDKQLSSVESKVKLSGSKLSQNVVRLASVDSHNNETSSSCLGDYFLVKSIFQGITNNGITAQAIVGARVSHGEGTSSTNRIEGNLSENIGELYRIIKTGAVIKYLGQLAGPIGADHDVGLNVWSFIKSIERLKNVTKNYKNNNAIAEIFTDLMTVTPTPVSVTVPPAEPLIIAAGALIDILNKWSTYLYRQIRHLEGIRSKDRFEESGNYIFTNKIFAWFETKQRDYVEFLLNEKPASNISLQHNLKFLQNNPSFLGLVFPSRTLKYGGSCYLTKQYCGLRNAFGCTRWEQKYTVGTGCEWNKPCPSHANLCTNQRVNKGYWGYEERTCICNDTLAKPEFGSPHKNSHVDFRNVRRIFWEKAVAKDVEGADFKCRPGSIYSHYKVHEPYYRNQYLCDGAIALMQPYQKRNGSQNAMVFDLGDGFDWVNLNRNDTTPNFFRVGDEGSKYFYGGGGKNEFLFDGNCNKRLLGTLSGGRSDTDSVTILSNCASRSIIYFADGRLYTFDRKLAMSLYHIEEIFGRVNEQEVVTVNDQLRSVALHGGRDTFRRDVVKIYNTLSSANVTVFIEKYTVIESTAKRGHVSIIAAKSWKGVTANLDIYPDKELKLNMMFRSTASRHVTIQHQYSMPLVDSSVLLKEMTTDNEMILSLRFKLPHFENSPQAIFFNEGNESTYSALLLYPSNFSAFYHILSQTTSEFPTRIGNPGVQNIFQINGPNWSATGGKNADHFIINSTLISLVDGGDGEDSLMIDPNLSSSLTIDLAANKTFRSIENILGNARNPEKVICACSTKLVKPQGGSSTAKDIVIVPSGHCKQRQLQILANGNVSVTIQADVNETQENTIAVVASAYNPTDPEADPLQFEMEVLTTSVSGLRVAIQLIDKNCTALTGSPSRPGTPIEILLKGTALQHAHFKLKQQINSSDPFLTSPYIQISVINSLEPSGQLVFERETNTPKVLYHLSTESTSPYQLNAAQGILRIANVFVVHNGTWNVTGGYYDDIIILHSSAQNKAFNLNGGNGGNNTLILESSQLPNNTGTLTVNLEAGLLGYYNKTTKGVIKNIQNVLGRIGEADVIHANCNTTTISGRGGAGKGNEDVILISGKNCSASSNTQKLEVHTRKFTNVKNTAYHGHFIYHVSDPITTELDIRATSNNFHLVEFGCRPWDHIQNIVFDPTECILGIKFRKNNADKVQQLKMFKNGNSTKFQSPVIQFHQPGSHVTSNIDIKKEAITATLMIYGEGLKANETVAGLPVSINRFIVNITKENFGGGGRLIGSSSNKANQFWINQLQTKLDILDGGNCDTNNGSCTNYLQFGDSLMLADYLQISLDEKNGNVRHYGLELISHLKNIHELRGRRGRNNYDSVDVSSCKIRQISEIEEIFIIPSNDCSFNITMEIGEGTRVLFENSSDFIRETSTAWMNSTFHYRFKSPTNFSICDDCEHDGFGKGATHTFYLPFSARSVDQLWFDSGKEELHYSIGGKEYHHKIIGGTRFGEQFYDQPVMTTEDGFNVRVTRDGSILLVSNAENDFRNKIIPTFEPIAKELQVSFMMQTATQFFYIGHGDGERDRNILQNMGHSESHLVGGGASNTIYEIVDLQKDVFIHTGFDDKQQLTKAKQTLDLTNIVVPIRMESGSKYIPKLERNGNHLVISMGGYEHKYPGNVWIVNGQQKQVASRIQLLLNNAIMDLVPKIVINQNPKTKEDLGNETVWEIRPKLIVVPEGSVYSISKDDFEDGHKIRVGNDAQSNYTFQIVRNGMDLYLTNLKDGNDVNLTTIMITDYLKGSETQQSRTVLAAENNTLETCPSRVFDVSVYLPGLNLLLNDSKVIQTGGADNQVIVPSDIQEWKHLLHKSEDILLKNISNIPRTF